MLDFITYETIIVFFFSIFVFLYYLSKIKHKALERTGIKHLEPSIVFGNLFWTVTGREHLSKTIKRIYDSFPYEKYVAIFEFMKPTIVLKDPELIKKVTIKDFNHFQDIPFQIDEDNDPVFGRILLTLKGLKWRQMRSAISPAFTSFKMKNMFNFMTDCAARGISYYEKKVEESPKNFEIDIKDLASRFITDVIASTAFGFDVDSLKDPANKFITEAMKLTSVNIGLMLKFTGFRAFPKLMKLLKIRLMPESSVAYFRKLLHKTLQEREESGIHRPDMLHLLLEAKKGSLEHELEEEAPSHFHSPNELTSKTKEKKPEWTDDDLIAQAIVFILAGQQTTSTVFSFLIYELAVNSEIQDRLAEEVLAVVATSNGKLTYKTLLEMEYLDMVISECLRKWAPIPFNNRLCVRDYDLGPVRDGSSDHIEVKKGETVWIPVHSIHMDPLLWNNPETFDPERFSKDDIPNIKPQSFMPFGLGPRNCIGSRFALLNLKVMLFHYIWKFRFEPCSRTMIPLRISSTTLFMESRDGYWVTMRSRIS